MVPCGKCLCCLVNKRNDWSFRLMQEYRKSVTASFLTLTYHHAPSQGVSKRHVQLFLKRLRKKTGQGLRYFAVGEYGEKTQRPHYHILLFNYKDEKFVRSSWTYNGKSLGILHFGKVTEASIMYTTKYVIQRAAWQDKTRTPPFTLMSRAYGIGGQYLSDQVVSWHRRNKFNYILQRGKKYRLPRYYKDKIWYRVKAKKAEYGILQHPDREKVNIESASSARKAKRKKVISLIKKGYKNPIHTMALRRNATMSRIKEKVAFTQTI